MRLPSVQHCVHASGNSAIATRIMTRLPLQAIPQSRQFQQMLLSLHLYHQHRQF